MVFNSNTQFYYTFLGIWMLGCYFQITNSQFAISININSLHSSFNDWFMVLATYAGDGLFLMVVGAVLIIINRKYWLVTILCLSIPSIITQVLKHNVFEDYHRPAVLMANIPNLYFVPGVEMNNYNSFPSGHTTAAFSLYTLLALLSKQKRWGLFWCVIAALVAISRVYLLQHFWVDILAGALIGTVVVTLIYTFFAPQLMANGTNQK